MSFLFLIGWIRDLTPSIWRQHYNFIKFRLAENIYSVGFSQNKKHFQSDVLFIFVYET